MDNNCNASLKINVVSFNCAGFKSSREYICNSMLSNMDIIALQETWLMPHEIMLPDALSEHFHSFSMSSVNVEDGLLRGRPYGGLSLLWNKRLSQIARIVQYDDDRLLGLHCTINESSVLFLNVYLPTECLNNYDLYMSYLGKIVSLANDPEIDVICVMGDLNASPNSTHFCELQNACSDNDLVIADVHSLPPGSYTHINNNNVCSWLDHIVLSGNVSRSFGNCQIDYGGSTSDHFPISFSLSLSSGLAVNDNDVVEDQIAWDFTDENKKISFQQLLSRHLEDLQIPIPVCDGINCNNDDHCSVCDEFYELLRGIILRVAESVFGYKRNNKHIVPGWNVYVSDLHEAARRNFLYWRSIGSPREGPDAFDMRLSRARFKQALRECKREEGRMRAEALAAKMVVGDSSGLWNDIRNLCLQKPSRAGKVDDSVRELQISNMWKERFQQLLTR